MISLLALAAFNEAEGNYLKFILRLNWSSLKLKLLNGKYLVFLFENLKGSCVFDTSAVATNSGCAITQYSGMICMGYQKDDCGENNPIYPCCKWIGTIFQLSNRINRR